MNKDLLTALANDEPIRAVYNRLAAILDEAWQKEKHKLHEEAELCDKIRTALHEPEDSAIYKWAAAYLEEAKKQEQSKNQEQRDYEERRREIEKEYLELKEKELQEMRRQELRNRNQRYQGVR